MRTTDTFLCPESQLSYIVNPALRTLVICILFIFIVISNYVIIVAIAPCSNNDRLLRVNNILLLKNGNKEV